MYFYYDSDLNVYNTLADAIQSKKQCWLYFHDDVLSKVNWKVEPLLSLDELYKIRAQYLREKYDYIILCYSGGTDSTAMLEAFYYNNIHIDEILVVGALSQDPHSGSDMNHNGDLYYNAFPLLKKLSFPNTKITVIDYTEYFRDDKVHELGMFQKYGNEWAKYVGSYQSVHNIFWHDLKRIVGVSNEKETAVILGHDKTRLEYDDAGKPYTRFSNMSFCAYGQNYDDENFHFVYFYSSGDQTSVDIMVKQAHILHKVEQTCKVLNQPVPEPQNILYRYRNPLVFKSGKSALSILSVRDVYLLKKQDSELYKMYAEGMKYLKQYMPLERKHTIFTRRYYIE